MASHLTGAVIAVLAPDGAGKTTLINALCRQLEPSFNGSLRYHFLTRQSGYAAPPVLSPHEQAPRSTIASAIKVVYYLALAWLVRAPAIRAAKKSGKLVVLDRDLVDAAIDPIRYRLGGPKWLQAILLLLAPRPDVTLVLNAPAHVIVRRSKELPPETVEVLLDRYRRHASARRTAVVLDASKAPEVVLSDALEALSHILGGRMAELRS